MSKPYPSQLRIKELFQYQNGNLIRKISPTNSVKIGDIAGTPDKDGYIVIGVDGKQCKAHRLIWIYFYGSIDPKYEIDHIDHNPSNNKPENLRLVNRSGNNWNRKNVKGYSWGKYSYSVYVTVNYKKIHLGNYKTEKEAIKARKKGEAKYYVTPKDMSKK